MSGYKLKIGLPLVSFLLLWIMLALGITTVYFTVLLGVILFVSGILFSVLLYEAMPQVFIETGVAFIVLGALLIVLPFAPELFL
ncbi:MAG: hypothetical protein ABIF08_03415 [Nanoarchaeota archaeon]